MFCVLLSVMFLYRKFCMCVLLVSVSVLMLSGVVILVMKLL